jgi:hypothetical protein
MRALSDCKKATIEEKQNIRSEQQQKKAPGVVSRQMYGHGKHQHIATQPYFAEANRGSHETWKSARPPTPTRAWVGKNENVRDFRAAKEDFFSHWHFHFRCSGARQCFSIQIRMSCETIDWLSWRFM